MSYAVTDLHITSTLAALRNQRVYDRLMISHGVSCPYIISSLFKLSHGQKCQAKFNAKIRMRVSQSGMIDLLFDVYESDAKPWWG